MTLYDGIDVPFDQALYTGASATTAEVPGRWEVSLAGHPYRVDRALDLQGYSGNHHSRRSIPVLRAQADTGLVPSEQSLNREGLFRRSQESWHHGAGQMFLDRSDSDANRFQDSKGVNVWDKWSLSLLPDTTNVLASAATNLRLTAAGSFMYVSDGQLLKYTPNINATTPAFTTVTGTPTNTCNWITTDGNTIYAAYTGGIYTTTRGAATATAFNTTLSPTVLGYVKGRLMAAVANTIYNVTSSAAPPVLLAQGNSDFAWVGFAEGPGYIYAAGYSGTRSLIYKITIQPDGTALSAPIVASELPTGETVRSIKGYLGLLLVGTDLGLRVGSIDGQGNVTFGALIPTTSPVLNFEPADRFVWYGLTNLDGSSTGLGRVDLTVFTQPLTPAYASDSMATAQGSVLSISSTANRRAFTVAGVGVFVESLNRVTSGTLTTGRLTYGVGDDKVAMFVDLRHQALNGTVGVAISTNSATPTDLGVSALQGTSSLADPFNARQQRGEQFNLTLTLTRATSPLLGPVVTRYTLRAYPAPSRAFTYTVPILLHRTVTDLNGNDSFIDVDAEREYLEDLCKTQQLFTYQEASRNTYVILQDFVWVPVKLAGENEGFTSYDGTFVATLKEINA